MSPVIRSIEAREVFDSRGRPTVETDVVLTDGTLARARVPSGTSTGRGEAVEIRDGDPRSLAGMGVLRSVATVDGEISRALRGMDPADQHVLDRRLIDLDGTADKSRLGGNALLSVSMASARAGALARRLPLYRHLSPTGVCRLPIPMINGVNGGAHAANPLEFEEFMLVPRGAATFQEALRRIAEIFHTLKGMLRHVGHGVAVGEEGGYAPDFWTAEEALAAMVAAIERSGYRPGTDVSLAIDVAAGELYEHGVYTFRKSGQRPLQTEGMIDALAALCDRFPLIYIEDGLSDEDREGWRRLTDRLGHRALIAGDDLFATNAGRIRDGIAQGLATAAVIKPNQIGTVSEAIEAIAAAREAGCRAVVAHRSGDTEDTFIADLCVATSAELFKAGSLARSERVAIYNQMLRIEEELGPGAVYGSADLENTGATVQE